jgi:hypothetical protein
MEIKSQLNVRITPDSNVSISVSRIIEGETDAEALGAEMNRLATAWSRGWDQQAQENT